MSSIPTYLLNRDGIWYFNYRIPFSVRNRYNIPKLFIRKSLHTKSVREAVQCAQKYIGIVMGQKKGSGWHKLFMQKKVSSNNNDIEKLEEDQEVLNDALVVGREIIEAYEATMQNGTYVEQNDFWLPYSEYEVECFKHASTLLKKEQAQKTQAKEEALKKQAKIFANEVNVHIHKSDNNSPIILDEKQIETSITISELIERFIDNKISRGKWNASVVRLQRGRFRVIKEFLEYSIGLQNPMIHLFKTEHAIMFEDEYFKYPVNCKKKFPNMTVGEVLSQINSVKFTNVDRIATNNYNEYARLLMALFKWAKTDKKRKCLDGENVFVELKKEGEPHKSYSPFTSDEIKLFFNSDLFTNKKVATEYAWRYWIPIIMMYHGMRLEEVAQLLTKNIIKKNSYWCFDIRDEVDSYGRILTTTKMRGRIVPIHPKVIEIGFLDYVVYQKKSGKSKVFPTLNNLNKKGEHKKAGSTVTAWFNEDSKKEYKISYLTKVGIDKKARHLVLYSFKHSAETLLINHPDNIEHDKIDTMIGHLVKSVGRAHYGEYYEETIFGVVEKIDYPKANLPWDTNTNYNSILFPWE